MSFDILDKNAIAQILIHCQPRDVISLLQISFKLAAVARDPDVFKMLIRIHYPTSCCTDNPRQQYIAITVGVETRYKSRQIHPDRKTYHVKPHCDRAYKYSTPNQKDKASKPEMTPHWSFGNCTSHPVISLLENPIFMAWLSTDQSIYQDMLTVLHKHKSSATYDMSGEEYDRAFSIHAINKHFKDFVNEYREGRLDKFIAVETSEKEVANFDNFVLGTLREAKSYEYHPSTDYSKKLLFHVRGNSIPKGTKVWLVLNCQSPIPISGCEYHMPVFERGRKEMATYFARSYFALVTEILRNTFKEYVGDNCSSRPELLDYICTKTGVNKIKIGETNFLKTEVFRQFLLEMKVTETDIELFSHLSPETLSKHAMTHDKLNVPRRWGYSIFLFFELTF